MNDMTRVEAYHILGKLWCDVTPEQAEAISMAQNDLEFVDLMPNDMVAVVRCKDCKRCDGFSIPNDIQPNEIGICKINMMAVKQDGFCSYGERMSDNG